MRAFTEGICKTIWQGMQSRSRYWKALVICFACIVTFITVYMLLLPAITLEKDASSVLACTVQIHTHDDSCYDEDDELICGKADYILHTHEEGCYDQGGALVCSLDEITSHSHGEECYTSDGKLICQLEEVAEAHIHQESCYDEDGELICGKPEVLEHRHGDGCYTDADSDEAQDVGTGSEAGIMALADDGAVSSFTMTYTYNRNSYTITFNLVDEAGNKLSTVVENITAESATRYIFGAAGSTSGTGSIKENLAPVISGYTYSKATYNNATVYSVATNGYQDGYGFNNSRYAYRIYSTEPIQAQQFYTMSSNITINLTYMKDSTDFSGKYAIVNNARNVAMMAADSEAAADRRAGRTTYIHQDKTDGTYYVADDTVTVWTFEKQQDGTYYIYTDESGTERYLYINSSSVILSDDPQKINVTEGTEDYAGLVRLTNSSGTAVNLYSGSASQGFGGWDDKGANEWQRLCIVRLSDEGLNYDINMTTTSVGDHIISEMGYWEDNENPTLPDIIQEVKTDGTTKLYSPGTPGEDGYFTYISYRNSQIGIAARMKADNKSPGKEFRFDGWIYYDKDKDETYTFAQEATATLKDDGIHIEDIDGTERILPQGATLTADWKEISDIVLFYVNYSGTILDTDGDVEGRNQGEFTGEIGIGHVYYGAIQAGKDEEFAADADATIRIDFTKEFDPDNPHTQIVMDYITTHENGKDNLYNVADGINDSELESALMRYIHDNEDVTIQVSTAGNENNPAIDSANATTDNYSVRWYVLKEQADAWHIDGVMVAKTEELIIKKNFTGLTAEQADKIMEDFSIDVKLGKEPQDYITITSESEENIGETINGYYEYLGREAPDSNIFKWRFHAIRNEEYTFEENNYGLKDEYGNSYSVYTTVVHQYDSTGAGNEITEYANSTTTGYLNTPVVGGTSDSVSFTNTYTKNGTGILSIIKTLNTDSTDQLLDRLRGAEFTLYDGNDSVVAVSTSNANGLVFFNNLEPGRYTLKETKSPDGFIQTAESWGVEVVKSNSDNVTVKINYKDEDGAEQEFTTFDSADESGDVIKYFHVKNHPKETTLQIKKTFKGLTDAEIAELIDEAIKAKEAGADGSDTYKITVTDAGGNSFKELSLLDINMYSSETGTFLWYVTDVEPGEYTITESGYLLDDYIDTVVDVNVNDRPVDKESLSVDRDTATAEFSIDKSGDDMDTVAITNTYLNTFTLKLRKISASGTPLPGAVFDIYGGYRYATDTSRRITYTNPDTGNAEYAYYMATTTSGNDGIAVVEDLHLSDDDNTFVYIYNEAESPDGYAPLNKAIVSKVTVTENGYEDGVYTLPVTNTLKSDSVTSVEVTKVWDSVTVAPSVTLRLYRQAEGQNDMEAVGEIELTANNSIDTGSEGTDADSSGERWTYKWTELPAYDEHDNLYTYYVYEVPTNGYLALYSKEAEIKVDGETAAAGEAEGTVNEKTVTVTNVSNYELPETGGPGDMLYTLAGLLLTGGALGLYIRRRSKGGGSAP